MQAYAKLQMRTEEKDMSYNIAVIPGDGIGPEIVREAQKVLDAAGKKYGFELKYTEVLMGGASIDVHGVPLTDEAIATAKASDAVLMGSIGGDANISKQVRFQPNGSAATARYGHRKKVCVRNTWHCQIVRVQSAYRQPYKEKRKDRQSHYANRAQDYRGCGTCP